MFKTLWSTCQKSIRMASISQKSGGKMSTNGLLVDFYNFSTFLCVVSNSFVIYINPFKSKQSALIRKYLPIFLNPWNPILRVRKKAA